jgi:hypothetical protein
MGNTLSTTPTQHSLNFAMVTSLDGMSQCSSYCSLH